MDKRKMIERFEYKIILEDDGWYNIFIREINTSRWKKANKWKKLGMCKDYFKDYKYSYSFDYIAQGESKIRKYLNDFIDYLLSIDRGDIIKGGDNRLLESGRIQDVAVMNNL